MSEGSTVEARERDASAAGRGARALQGGVLLASLLALYATAGVSYLLFHSLVETFSAVVALSIFMVTWLSRRYLENTFLLVAGIAFLPLGFLDLLHTLAYRGMPVFPDHPFGANQLWIGARYLESLSYLAGFAVLGSRWRPRAGWLLGIFLALTALLVASIFAWHLFPACFVEGVGQTRFKIVSEYVVIALLVGGLALLAVQRDRFDPAVRRAIAGAMMLTVASEFCFTLYVSNYGLSNLVGHLFKLVSYALLYVALAETGVGRPFDLVFRELTSANARLQVETEARQRAIGELRAALDEIETLRGIIPICAHCKQIRDDRGAWSQMEAYIQRHSAARFSHGICPTCLARYYPDVENDTDGSAEPG